MPLHKRWHSIETPLIYAFLPPVKHVTVYLLCAKSVLGISARNRTATLCVTVEVEAHEGKLIFF